MIVIYKITNIVNDKIYIGSTKDFATRCRTHINELNKNTHRNSKLQNSWNKYGKNNFRFEIIEYDVKDQYFTEQLYLDKLSLNKDTCFNLTFVADGGGSDTLKIRSYVLDLNGNIISKHDGIYKAFESIGSKYNLYYNSKAKVKRKYRIVTEDYYINNQEQILKWPNKTKAELQKDKVKENSKYRIIYATVDNIEYEFKSIKEAALYFKINPTLIYFMLQRVIKNRYNFRKIPIPVDDIWYNIKY
jgi:group I intron endonuclease